MTIPADWPIGRLTMRSERGGVPGRKLTADELSVDVLAAARSIGFRDLSPFELQSVLRVQSCTEGQLVGTVTLDAGGSAALANAAARAVAWLNERAPAGHRFVLRDALYLERISEAGSS